MSARPRRQPTQPCRYSAMPRSPLQSECRPRPSRVGALDLLERVHRERARPLEPALVARALEELEEGVAVAGGAVAEAGALRQRACAPGELAALDEQLGEARRGRARSEPSDATIPGAPWHHCVRMACGVLGGSRAGGHCASPSARCACCRDHVDRTALELGPSRVVEQVAAREHEDVADEAVRRAEHVCLPAGHRLEPELARPTASHRPSADSRHASAHIGSPRALVHDLRGEHRPRRAPGELDCSGSGRSRARTSSSDSSSCGAGASA